MDLMEKENIKLFNKEEKKSKKIPKKSLTKRDLEVVPQITIGDLNQIVLKKDEAIQNILMAKSLQMY